ncbi:MAG: TRIC cation channel family protein, partial [Xanthobacteraceae bacterium]
MSQRSVTDVARALPLRASLQTATGMWDVVPRNEASRRSAGAARSGLAMQTLLLVLDLVGTFVFALSGGMAGVNRRLDIFGVLVLA